MFLCIYGFEMIKKVYRSESERENGNPSKELTGEHASRSFNAWASLFVATSS